MSQLNFLHSSWMIPNAILFISKKWFIDFFVKTIFSSSHNCPDNPEETRIILGSMNITWDITYILSRAWWLNCGHVCAFGHVDGAVSGGKPPAGKGVVGLLSWHGSHFWVCITFCKVRHNDSVTTPDYYYYIIILFIGYTIESGHSPTMHVVDADRRWGNISRI